LKTRTKAKRRRARGRPNEGKNAVGADLLLKAARELLETLPPAKVTRAAVARQAGVDPNLIRYYFTDRDSLLLSVAEQVVEEQMADESERVTTGTPTERLRSYVRWFVEFNTRHPYFHRLLNEEIALWKTARSRQLFQRLNQEAIGVFKAIVEDGVKDQSLAAVDPTFLHIALVGMTEFFLGSRVVLEDSFGKGTLPVDYAERYADTMVQMIVDGVRER
jgi:AcrR family transcriptional regulator